MKKQLLLSTITGLIATSAFCQQKFIITGNMAAPAGEYKVFLNYADDGSARRDSAITTKGEFRFSGTVTKPTRASLELRSAAPDTTPMTLEKMMARDQQEFYLEKGTITVAGSNLKTATIKGGKTQSDYRLLQNKLKPFQDSVSALTQMMMAAQKEKRQAAQAELFPKFRAVRTEIAKAEEAFLYAYPDSYVNLDLLQARSAIIDPTTFAPLYEALSDRLKTTPAAVALAQRLVIAKKTAVGQPAMDFTQNDTLGVPVSLASLKGKYVLVDFWASWCGPCRAENPNVVKAYNAFKSKNFEIIGVSLDDKKDPWVKAIDKDGLPWIHVSDLKGWKNAVAAEYGVQAVPQNFLLNPEGTIIATNLRGDELAAKLSQLVKD